MIYRDIPFRLVFHVRMPKPHRLPNIDEQTVLEELQVCLALPCERTRWNKLVREHH